MRGVPADGVASTRGTSRREGKAFPANGYFCQSRDINRVYRLFLAKIVVNRGLVDPHYVIQNLSRCHCIAE